MPVEQQISLTLHLLIIAQERQRHLLFRCGDRSLVRDGQGKTPFVPIKDEWKAVVVPSQQNTVSSQTQDWYHRPRPVPAPIAHVAAHLDRCQPARTGLLLWGAGAHSPRVSSRREKR